MEEKSMHIVIVGHVDHGKSTLIGRLFYDTGYLHPDKEAELRKMCESMGKELEFAFMMDHLEEERRKGITIDIAHTFFKTDKRRYVIIDAPGHKEFLKNMISGTSQADASLLLVDANEGVQEQTHRHCYILGLLGIKQVAVVVNKMDLVDYSQERFESISGEITDILSRFDITPSFVVPISARIGDNVAKRSENLGWFDGPTVLGALDSFDLTREEFQGLRFPVQDVYEGIEADPVSVGRVESGTIRDGQEYTVLPGGGKCRVRKLMKFEEALDEASYGDCIGITTEEEPLGRGDVIVSGDDARVTDTIRANIFWMVDKSYKLGIPILWKCATQEATGTIARIYKRFDPASISVVEKDATEIKPAEVAEVEIKLSRPVLVDEFSRIAETGRFVLEHNGHPVAGGIVI